MTFAIIGDIMKHYELIKIDDHNYLAIILSIESIGSYIQLLHRDISRLDSNVKGVYMDFLLRNGLNNRFYKINVKDHSFDDGSISRCLATKKLNDVSNHFFVNNSKYIQRSVMPSSQKARYISMLSKLIQK